MEPITKPPNPFMTDAGGLALASVGDVFFLPGDWLIYLLASRVPGAADLLALGPGDYGGTLAAFLSSAAWLALALGAIATTSAVRRFDRALTSVIVGAALDARRRLRMALVFARYRRKRQQVRTEPAIDVGELPSLRPVELRVLELHARLAPGFALAVSDVAEELAARGYEVRGVLERLRQLNLLQATVGGLDGEPAYTLTATGRALLRLARMRPRPA
jgi:hypothetical protein